MYLRQKARNDDDVARRKVLEKAMTSQIEGAAQADLTNKPDWTNSEIPLVAEFNLKIPDFLVNAGSRAVIPAALFTSAEKTVFVHANRVHPIYIEYLYEKIDDITLELPDGWRSGSLPPALDLGPKGLHYTFKAEQGQGTVHLTRNLTIGFMSLEQKYYPSLRSLFQSIRSGDGEQIVLQSGETHAGN